MTAIDRTPKPCLHPQTNHQHGTRACYALDGCRCLPCKEACYRYNRSLTLQHAYGRWNNLVDAEPARAHVRELMRRGMGRRTIARQAGISESAVTNLIWGKPRSDGGLKPTVRLRERTADKILGVSYSPADGALVPSIGAVRRIRALVALGWSQSKLSAQLGFKNPTQLTGMANGRTDEIFARNDRAVRELYEALSMRLPPQETHREKVSASRARNYAKNRGWLPPLAWDDESLDDPVAAPLTGAEQDETYLDQAAIERRMAGDKSVALIGPERAELVRRLIAQGVTHADIERRTGINPRRHIVTPQGVSA